MTVEDALQKFYFAVYWIVGILLIGTISFVLYGRFNKQVAGVFVFLLGALALYYYYVKWFIVGSAFKPPVTVCPDFLVNAGVANKETGQFVCIDTVGVSAKQFAVKTDAPALTGTVDKAGTVNSVVGYVVTPATSSTASDMSTFCGSLKMAGLSWISMCNNL